MTKHTYSRAAALLVAVITIIGCNDQNAPAEAAKFDPKYIAAEADKGNLEPLKRLNEACRAEVKREGKRMATCKAQDDVGSLMKPLNIRF